MNNRITSAHMFKSVGYEISNQIYFLTHNGRKYISNGMWIIDDDYAPQLLKNYIRKKIKQRELYESEASPEKLEGVFKSLNHVGAPVGRYTYIDNIAVCQMGDLNIIKAFNSNFIKYLREYIPAFNMKFGKAEHDTPAVLCSSEKSIGLLMGINLNNYSIGVDYEMTRGIASWKTEE
jgi:hypothetical protein